MKLKFDPSLQYQQDAVNAVVGVFDGQPFAQTGAMAFQSLQIGGLFQTELGMGNRLDLPFRKRTTSRRLPRFRAENSQSKWRRAPARRTSISARFSS
jgi:restriction endonuclease